MDNFITIKETAELWRITPRRVQKLCADGKKMVQQSSEGTGPFPRMLKSLRIGV